MYTMLDGLNRLLVESDDNGVEAWRMNPTVAISASHPALFPYMGTGDPRLPVTIAPSKS